MGEPPQACYHQGDSQDPFSGVGGGLHQDLDGASALLEVPRYPQRGRARTTRFVRARFRARFLLTWGYTAVPVSVAVRAPQRPGGDRQCQQDTRDTPVPPGGLRGIDLPTPRWQRSHPARSVRPEWCRRCEAGGPPAGWVGD